VRVIARDEPVSPGVSTRAAAGAVRVLPPRAAPRFNLAGLHWRGSGTVWFRTATANGPWSRWRPARPEAEDRPDLGTAEARARRGWNLGNPWWTGTATRIQYRFSGGVARLRAYFLWSPVRETAQRRTAAAIPGAPAVIVRPDWGADESIVSGAPLYAERLAFAVVHHTAGTTPSSPAQSAAIVRGVQSYHVRSNGWNDIGYNFLVDPFGQVFEGRVGGITRNVVGAHAQGFNTGSVGVAVLGSYNARTIAPAAREALAALLAWRLDLAHVEPTSLVTRVSGGSNKWAAGTPVSLRAVSGHRDLGLTACPGELLYGELGALAADAAALGLPKLYDPRVDGQVGGSVRFTARLSTSVPWTVTVFDALGVPVAAGSGSGTRLDWTWSAIGVPPGRYTYAIDAGPDVRPVRAPLGGTVPLELTSLSISPGVVTPNGDGASDSATLRVSVTAAASLDVWLESSAGERVATLFARRGLESGASSLVWRGRDAAGRAVPDGRHRLVAEAVAGTERVRREAALLVDRTLGHLSVAPAAFSPNGDGRRDRVSVGWELTRAATLRVRVFAGSRSVATVVEAPATATAPGRQSHVWEGARLGDGRYRVVAEATTPLGTRRLERQIVLDTRAPRVRGLSARRVRRGTLVRFRLSEPGRVTVRLGRRTVRLSVREGRVTIQRRVRARAVSVTASDAALNASRVVRTRVRRR
jgi:hypothetical protein